MAIPLPTTVRIAQLETMLFALAEQQAGVRNTLAYLARIGGRPG
jgi:hypothetical protein